MSWRWFLEVEDIVKQLTSFNYDEAHDTIPKDKKTVTSMDGTTTVLKPRSLGKKIGQRKREVDKWKDYNFQEEEKEINAHARRS